MIVNVPYFRPNSIIIEYFSVNDLCINYDYEKLHMTMEMIYMV